MHIMHIIIASFVSIGIYDTIEDIIYVIGAIFSVIYLACYPSLILFSNR